MDLNGDGVPEVLAYVFGGGMCGTGGCTTYVLVRRGESYVLQSTITVTWNPVIVLKEKTHGWSDLAVFVAGGGILPGYYTHLKFDGAAYPENATAEPALNRKLTGTAYLAGDRVPKTGIRHLGK